jgi:hypothetical protein
MPADTPAADCAADRDFTPNPRFFLANSPWHQ